MFSNILKAPKSTLLAILLLFWLTVAKGIHVIESETYGTLSAIVIPLAFTDLFKEKKTPEA